MKNVLIIGSTGQIGSELVVALREHLKEKGTVVAGYTKRRGVPAQIRETGPAELVDILDKDNIEEVVKRYQIDTIYNLAAVLSATAEANPVNAWRVGIDGLINVLEVARIYGCAVFTPSSIGAFGPDSPKNNTPQDCVMRPTSIYGVSKVTGELLSDYYFRRYGVDTRSVRFPGLISYATPPGGGTTDYAVDIFYSAVRNEPFACPIPENEKMDFMYMPDAIRAAIEIMETDPTKLIHRNSFNITAMSFSPAEIAEAIKKNVPGFKIHYEVDPLRKAIAESWPNKMDETCAEKEWGWKPKFTLDEMVKDMLKHVRAKEQQE